jgi:prevent-host-death family protein
VWRDRVAKEVAAIVAAELDTVDLTDPSQAAFARQDRVVSSRRRSGACIPYGTGTNALSHPSIDDRRGRQASTNEVLLLTPDWGDLQWLHVRDHVIGDVGMNIPAGKFKAHCLQLIDLVKEKRSEIIVTKRGKPVARLVPLDEPGPSRLFGRLKGSVTIVGDITLPIDERWDADES